MTLYQEMFWKFVQIRISLHKQFREKKDILEISKPHFMATVKAFIRSTSRKGNKTDVAVRFRLSDGVNIQLYHTSDIMVDPEVWDAKKECI